MKMLDERRHSVDIPISRTLMALMRSRSLRDPDTNSLAKFNALLEKSSRQIGPCNHTSSDLNGLSRHSFSCAWSAHMEKARECTQGLDADMDLSLNSLNHKYKPSSFDELVGQSVVVQSLRGVISKGVIAPVYLFHGPGGTGKSSAARIFAAGLNCRSLNKPKPCGFCHECMLVLSGKSREVKEFEASKLNSRSKIVSLLRSASLVPQKLQYKVFIIDDCHNLEEEAWSSLCTNLEFIPQYLVLVMVTTNLEKLPDGFVPKCHSCRFGKIENSCIVSRLRLICMKEGFDFEEGALELLARKAEGSIREAITVLDQLSLLGRRITRRKVYELIGDVSEDELIELLDLAFSSDAASMVVRAREIMSSKVDPMQLSSQLANLIMDVLAAKCQQEPQETTQRNIQNTFPEVGTQRLRNALEILSETEKQLKTAKNPSTWLTAALLQFNSNGETVYDSSSIISKLPNMTAHDTDDKLMSRALAEEDCGSSSLGEDGNTTHLDYHLQEPEILNVIWRRALEKCTSDSLKDALQKEGKLSSIYFYQGLAIAVIELCKSNKSDSDAFLEPIVTSLQSVLGCNIEIRINVPKICTKKLEFTDSTTNGAPLKKSGNLNDCSTQDEINSEEQLKRKMRCSSRIKACLKCFFSCRRRDNLSGDGDI
ncbi:DNA polymerase III subunit gamma/tau [Rhynchospora pubera]|uniref:DNA polymerase III subunit gamma/tau n=1 Tax=Rhynchospora pubera TaxID=906938 RepID=A0AAV8GTT0_9POAL|nr:DNA polymerase III subunit gamma/tau [Rhynchospora pubera]